MKWLFPLLFLFPFLAFPQGQANNWYFGNKAGITFNTTPPTVLFDGQLNTNEGCSSISNIYGELLFYTDGRTIWNREHQIMPNGNYFGGTGLLGDPSSTSSGLIVPHPANENRYFVFTVDEPHQDNAAAYPNQGPATQDGTYSDTGGIVPPADDGYNNGLNYSIVDMSLENGLGDVVQGERNNHLITYDPSDPEEIKYKCSEKITAVKGADCSSIWVLSHFINRFYAFKIDQNGVDPNPVVSTLGPVVPLSSYRRGAIGYMKISPDGNKLLVAHNTTSFDPQTPGDEPDGGVYLYDFNDVTGEVSNGIPLIEQSNAYGVEFSINSKMAYATVAVGNNLSLYQWDLESSDIPASRFEFSGVSGSSPTALQLGPNGKIYRAILGTTRLGVINHPELTGTAADYSENVNNGAIELNRQVFFGLPPFIQSIFSSGINIVNDSEEITTELELCDGESYTLEYDAIPGASYQWFKDENLLPAETSPTLTISQPLGAPLPYTETYRLEVNLNDGSCPDIGIANVTYYPKPQISNAVYAQCSFNSESISLFNLEQSIPEILNGLDREDYSVSFFENVADAQNETDEITEPTTYQNTVNNQILGVRVSNKETGCFAIAELELVVLSGTDENPVIELSACDTEGSEIHAFDLTETIPEITLGNPNLTVAFFKNLENAYTELTPIENPSEYQNTSSSNLHILYARAENASGQCAGIWEIQLTVDDLPPVGEDLTGENSLIYCLERFPEKITLSSGIPENELDAYTYFWEPTGDTTPTIETNELGEYTITVTNIETGCSTTRTINIVPSNIASFRIERIDASENNSLTVILTGENFGEYEYALDNINGPYQDESIFEGVSPGIHTVYVRDKNGCGISKKEINLLGIMEFFTPNNDGINDRWGLLGVGNGYQLQAELYIYNRYGKLLETSYGISPGWDGTYNGKKMPSNDYWYNIVLEDGRVLKGNFTLKR